MSNKEQQNKPGNEDRTGSQYHDKWASYTKDELAKAEEEEKTAKEAADKDLGRDNNAPTSKNEQEAIGQKEALKQAKEAWQSREDKVEADKVWVQDLTGVTQDIVMPDDNKLHAVHIRNCTSSNFSLPKGMKSVKVFFEGCKESTLTVDGEMVTENVEIWRCHDCTVTLKLKIGTVQADICTGTLNIHYDKSEFLGQIVHAGIDKLNITFGDDMPAHTTEADELLANQSTDEKSAAEAALAKSKGAVMAVSRDETQFITRIVKGAPLTERVVRGADEYISTLRELKEMGAEKSLSIAEDETKSRQARSLKRREKGNEAFKEKNFTQAACSYTEALELYPEDAITLSNRAAAFLKMGHHEKALADAEKAIEYDPKFVKGHFRKGLALHALGRYGDAVGALSKATDIDGSSKQILDAIKMAEYMARKHGGNKKD